MARLPHNDSLVATVGEFAAIANITSNSSSYDDYAYVHSDLNPVIHFTGRFSSFSLRYMKLMLTFYRFRSFLSIPSLLRLVLHSSTQTGLWIHRRNTLLGLDKRCIWLFVLNEPC